MKWVILLLSPFSVLLDRHEIPHAYENDFGPGIQEINLAEGAIQVVIHVDKGKAGRTADGKGLKFRRYATFQASHPDDGSDHGNQ